MRIAKWVATSAVLLVLSACSPKSTPGRVVVLGFDGMDPQSLDLLMSEGKMPNFAKLRRQGAYAPLTSMRPLLSPVIWTTIATGKTPDEHHISHFVAVNRTSGEELPVTSRMRRAKAIWNILSDAGRKVDVVGYWATWPAETVNGAIVSDHTCYHFLFPDGGRGAPDPTGVTYPPDLYKTLAPMIRRPSDLTMHDVAPFISVSPDAFAQPFDFKNDLSEFKWALATAETYQRIGLYLWRRQHPDLLMVYIEATDSVSHLFGHLFHVAGLKGALAVQQQHYGNAVEQMYRYADQILGNYMQALGDKTTLIVLSDHGFKLGVLHDNPDTERDMRRVSERYHRLKGILYLYGYHVRPGSRLENPGVLDITPTILALTGLSPARDMPGRVLTEGLDLKATPRTVASYETERQAAAAPAADAQVDPAVLEHLRSLGYLSNEQSAQGTRNLAAIQFESGHYEEALTAYQKLVQENPNDGTLRASLGGVLGALGRFDEARQQLRRAVALAPLNPEAHQNLALIYEKEGKREAAIDEFRTALRYNPQYAPARRALIRLTGSAAIDVPHTDAQRRAEQLAQQASQAARRGDYAGAMKLLDQAKKLAPRYALVYQYRSNVAYLMGDRRAAIAALREGLKIQPDNVLFKTNLEYLEQEEAASRARPASRQHKAAER